jgi:hypothetical protein
LMSKFVANSVWDENAMEKMAEEAGTIDECQIMKWTAVGNDGAVHLCEEMTQTFEIGGEFLVLTRAEGLRVFEEGVSGKTVEFQELANFGMGELASLICLGDEGFEGAARKVSRLGTKSLDEPVRQRDFDCGGHGWTR